MSFVPPSVDPNIQQPFARALSLRTLVAHESSNDRQRYMALAMAVFSVEFVTFAQQCILREADTRKTSTTLLNVSLAQQCVRSSIAHRYAEGVHAALFVNVARELVATYRERHELSSCHYFVRNLLHWHFPLINWEVRILDDDNSLVIAGDWTFLRP